MKYKILNMIALVFVMVPMIYFWKVTVVIQGVFMALSFVFFAIMFYRYHKYEVKEKKVRT